MQQGRHGCDSHGLTVCFFVVVLWTGTGNAFHEDVNAFLDAGANAVYCKPAGRKQLQEAIDKWCPRKESSSVTENSLKSVACERSAS